MSVGVLLHAAHATEHQLELQLEHLGLSLAKLAALKALAEAGESLPLTRLAERLSCVKSNITQLVDRLETDGLVQRQADPNDRRARLAVLTPAGQAAYRKGIEIEQAAERELLQRLTAEESEMLTGLLAKLASA